MSKSKDLAQELKEIALRIEDVQLLFSPLHLKDEKANGLIDAMLSTAKINIDRVAFYLPSWNID